MENNEIDEIKAALREALDYIREEKYSKAMIILRMYIEDIEKKAVRETEDTSFFSFSNEFEALLFVKLYMPKKPIKSTPFEYHILYRLYGFALYKLDRMAEAVQALEKAVSWNPVNMEALFMLCDMYEVSGRFDKLELLARDGLKTAYHNNYIAKFYMYTGICFEAKGDIDAAIMLYDISFAYNNTSEAVKKLSNISKKLGKKLRKPKTEDIIEAFEKRGIQFGANQEVMNFTLEFFEAAKEQNDTKTAEYCYNLYLNLNADKEVLSKLTKIRILESRRNKGRKKKER